MVGEIIIASDIALKYLQFILAIVLGYAILLRKKGEKKTFNLPSLDKLLLSIGIGIPLFIVIGLIIAFIPVLNQDILLFSVLAEILLLIWFFWDYLKKFWKKKN